MCTMHIHVRSIHSELISRVTHTTQKHTKLLACFLSLSTQPKPVKYMHRPEGGQVYVYVGGGEGAGVYVYVWGEGGQMYVGGGGWVHDDNIYDLNG